MPPAPDRFDELSLVQLRTFQLVYREGGYAAAARLSHLSVPSIWQQIHDLEDSYGVRLFERVGRSIRATDAADRLHEILGPAIERIDSAFELLGEAPRGQPVRLVAGARMMLEDLAQPLAQFQKTHTSQLLIRQGNDRRAEELLLDDQTDLALALEPPRDRRSSLIHYEPAYTVEFLAVAKKSHPYMKGRAAALRELAKHDLVVTVKGTHGRDALDQAFERDGLNASIVAETDNSAFTIACVASGMGIGILAGRKSGELCKSLATRSLSRHLGQKRIILMWRKGRVLTDPMVDLVESIKAIAN